MRKTDTKILRKTGAIVLSFSLAMSVATGLPVATAKASKPKLESKKGTFLTGEAKTVAIKNVTKKNIKKLTVTSTKKTVATAKKSGKTAIVITSKNAGKATVNAVVTLKNKKKYKLAYTATVKDTLDRQVLIVNANGTESSITLRFFAKMPNVPYVRATDYYAKLSGDKELKVEKKAEEEYLLTAASGETATLNTATDVLKADHYEEFSTCRTASEGPVKKNTITNGSPYVQALDDVVSTPDQPVTIDFSKYHLDLKGDTADVWMPIETAANLFVNAIGETMCYTGSMILQVNHRNIANAEGIMATHPEFLTGNLARYPGGTRPDDLAEYCYDELMFMLDTNYGNPGRCYFADAIRDKGFDRALSETDDQTRGVQKLLKSSSALEYLMGIGILSDMLFDGGHTWFNYGTMGLHMALTGGTSMDDLYKNYYADLYKYAAMIGYTPKYATDNTRKERETLIEKKAGKGLTDYGYKQEGDTAVYSFNQFWVDVAGWKNYYQNGGELPVDTYGQLIRYLRKAEESGTVRNFVFDVTTNGGGDEDSLVAIMDLIAGDPNIRVINSKTGRRYIAPYKIDKNLDGKVDEKDDAIVYKDKFNYAILSSKYAFSCGNALPCFAKANGIMVIGERSGGGSCQTILTALGSGEYCMISRSKALTDKNGNGVDNGVEPDKAIAVKAEDDGCMGYGDYYDIPALSKSIHEFYKK